MGICGSYNVLCCTNHLRCTTIHICCTNYLLHRANHLCSSNNLCSSYNHSGNCTVYDRLPWLQLSSCPYHYYHHYPSYHYYPSCQDSHASCQEGCQDCQDCEEGKEEGWLLPLSILAMGLVNHVSHTP